MDIELFDVSGTSITVIKNVTKPNALFESIKLHWNADSWKEKFNVKTTAEMMNDIRNRRDMLLTRCDWTQISDTPLTLGDQTLWSTYRTQLRDLPLTINPMIPTWPSDPNGNK